MIYSYPLFAALVFFVVIAGYAIRPFEKRASEDSFIHYIKWILLAILIFLALQNPVESPLFSVLFIGLSVFVFLVLSAINKKRGKKNEFTSVTVSNIALILVISLALIFLLVLIIFSGANY